MNEQTETTEEKTETPVSDNEGGSESEEDPVGRADALVKRLKEENDRTEELVKRQERLEASRRLGGKSSAGEQEQKKEIDPVEYSKAALRGELLG